MKNFIYLVAVMLMLGGCEKSDSFLEMEKEVKTETVISEPSYKFSKSESEAHEIFVKPADRQLYEYSVLVTEEYNKELEYFFSDYKKKYGEEYPAKMQFALVEDPKAIAFRPPPIPCICPPRLLPEDYNESLKMEDVTFEVFAYDPTNVSIQLTNESGELIYRSPSTRFDWEVKPEYNKSTRLKLEKVGEIRGKEFFITVNTNYIEKGSKNKKSLKYTVSEELL